MQWMIMQEVMLYHDQYEHPGSHLDMGIHKMAHEGQRWEIIDDVNALTFTQA